MESFGKSSLKAERKEYENDPNVAASEEICSPYARHGLRESHEFKEGTREKPGVSRIPRRKAAQNHPSMNIHPKAGNKRPLQHPRGSNLPGCCTCQTLLSRSPSLPFPGPNLGDREASESTGDDSRLGCNQTSTEPSIHRLRADQAAQVLAPVRRET